MMEKMENRGVTRPEMKSKNEGGNGSAGMNKQDHLKMLVQHHHKTQWVYWTIILLGVWLILSPLTFDYSRGIVLPTGGRTVWLPLSLRISILR